MDLSLDAIFETPTVAGLAEAVQRSRRISPDEQIERIADTTDPLPEIDQLSDEEVDALLDELLTEEGMLE